MSEKLLLMTHCTLDILTTFVRFGCPHIWTRVSNFSSLDDGAVKAEVLILFWALYHQYPAWKHAGGKKLWLRRFPICRKVCFENQTADALSVAEHRVPGGAECTRPSWAALRTGSASAAWEFSTWSSVVRFSSRIKEPFSYASRNQQKKQQKWKEKHLKDLLSHWEVSLPAKNPFSCWALVLHQFCPLSYDKVPRSWDQQILRKTR